MDDHLGSPRCRAINIKPQKLNSQKWSTLLQSNNNLKKKKKRRQNQPKCFLHVHSLSGKAISLHPRSKGTELLLYSERCINSPSSWAGDFLWTCALSQSQHSTKTGCCKANRQGTPSAKLQEDSCPIIGFCIFVLIVSLQNTSVKLQRIYLTSIADRFFYSIHQSDVLCACSSVLFTTWMIHELTQFTVTFIFVTVAFSLYG